ncbi:MAG: hypothetical protein GY774_18500 [Planctomycetes bacterium]|nr:hypothetical protein [Planctomycetota bacterium]
MDENENDTEDTWKISEGFNPAGSIKRSRSKARKDAVRLDFDCKLEPVPIEYG